MAVPTFQTFSSSMKAANPSLSTSYLQTLYNNLYGTTAPKEPTISTTPTTPTTEYQPTAQELQQQSSTALQQKAADAYNAYASIANLGPTNPQVIAAKKKYTDLTAQMGTSTYLPGFGASTPTTTTAPTATTSTPSAPTYQTFSKAMLSVNPSLTQTQLQQQYNSLYGSTAKQEQPKPPPSIETYTQSVKTVNPNLTPSQIQQQYQSLYGTQVTPTTTATPTQIPSTLTEQRRLATSLGISNFIGTQDQMNQLIQKVQQPVAEVTPAVPTTAPATQYQNLLSQTGFLKTGAKGEEVTQLQQFLQSQGYSPGVIDGVFGNKTAAALKQFQQSAGISADAVVGPQTRQAIQSKLGVTPPAPVTPTEAGPGVAEGGEPNQKDQELFGILQSYGLDIKDEKELADAFKFQPTRTFEEIYKEMYDAVGLDKVRENIEKTTAKLKELDDKHQQKVGEINENPWISETLRVKKLGVEDNRYQSERGTEAENLQLLQKQFDDAQDEIKFTAKETLANFYKEREFEQDELERILKRAEDELESRRKVSTKVKGTTVVVGGRKLLIDPYTGETIKDLGASGTKTTPKGEPESDIDSLAEDYLNGIIDDDDIPLKQRAEVKRRANEFATEALASETPLTPISPTKTKVDLRGTLDKLFGFSPFAGVSPVTFKPAQNFFTRLFGK